MVEPTIQVIAQILEHNSVGAVWFDRINLNTTFYSEQPATPPHVDLPWPHSVLLVYLTAFSGGRTWVGGEQLPQPYEDSAVIFDGEQPHYPVCPDAVDIRRIVLNVCYRERQP